jgi:hypothetical protein
MEKFSEFITIKGRSKVFQSEFAMEAKGGFGNMKYKETIFN